MTRPIRRVLSVYGIENASCSLLSGGHVMQSSEKRIFLKVSSPPCSTLTSWYFPPPSTSTHISPSPVSSHSTRTPSVCAIRITVLAGGPTFPASYPCNECRDFEIDLASWVCVSFLFFRADAIFCPSVFNILHIFLKRVHFSLDNTQAVGYILIRRVTHHQKGAKK